MQQARALEQSEAFAGYRRRRVVVEHRLARLVQLGIRQARYFGRIKTRFQLDLAATVANLTLVAGKYGSVCHIGGAAIGDRPACAGAGGAAANKVPLGSAESGPSFCSRRHHCPHSSSQQGVSVRVSSTQSTVKSEG